MKNFEMAYADDPSGMVKAAQRAFIASMKNVVALLKKDIGGPGMTWEDLEHFLSEFEKKEPTIIEQSEEM